MSDHRRPSGYAGSEDEFIPAGPPELSEALPPGTKAVDAALWLIAHHHEQVRGVEGERFTAWRERVGPEASAQALAVGRALLRTWVDQTIAALDARHDRAAAWAEAAIGRVRATMLDAWRAPLHSGGAELFPDPHDPSYWLQAGARLLRGAGNCDSMNHMLALLLTRWGRPELIDVRSHRLVRLAKFDGCRGPVFVDALTPLPPFVIGEATGPAVHAHAEILAQAQARAERGQGEEPLDAQAYLAAPLSLGLIERRPAPSPWPAELPAPNFAARPKPTEATIYHVARAHDLFGSRDMARRAYQAVTRRTHARALTHALARTFGALLDDPDRP